MGPVVVLNQAGDWAGVEGGLGALEDLAKRALSAGASVLPDGPPAGETTLVLCDDAQVRALNAQFRKADKPTNVLAFPVGDSHGETLGDVVIALETLTAEAQARGLSFFDHLAHLMIHGYLHLCGYDHKSPEDAGIMENMERRALAQLGIANPYQDHCDA